MCMKQNRDRKKCTEGEGGEREKERERERVRERGWGDMMVNQAKN